MGIKVAPTIANLCVNGSTGNWREHLRTLEHWANQCLIPGSDMYIDYIIITWFNTRDSLEAFLRGLSDIHYSMTETQWEGLQTKPYYMAIQTNSFLHYAAHHPKHTFKGIKSQAIRLLSDDIQQTGNILYLQALERLKDMLQNKGYPTRAIKKELHSTKGKYSPEQKPHRWLIKYNSNLTLKTLHDALNVRQYLDLQITHTANPLTHFGIT